jgi:hypothetical protein
MFLASDLVVRRKARCDVFLAFDLVVRRKARCSLLLIELSDVKQDEMFLASDPVLDVKQDEMFLGSDRVVRRKAR